ncbi:MAG TPA: IclR family transcriptional regulator [Ilumatobacteraceae bacterium]|nr:IclR family transcriptional regulator [Ilumatobacteraceae bacterium]
MAAITGRRRLWGELMTAAMTCTPSTATDAYDVDETDGRARSVIGRAAIVLDAFVDDCVLSLADLTVATGLPRSTVYRFAEQLVGIGWIDRVFNGYRVGLRLFEIGGRASSANRLRDCAGPWLLQAQQRSGLAVHLGVLSGSDVVYIDRLVCSRFRVPSRLGARRPAHCTALGKAMLAHEPDVIVDEYVDRHLSAVTPATLTSPAAFRASLGLARTDGAAIEHNEAVVGLSCVAAPVRGSGRAVGAISIVGPALGFDVRANTAIVRSAANGIWNELMPSRRS